MATLLLIDDSENHRAWLRSAIDASGVFAEIIEVSDGLKGLRALLEKPIDVVLCRLELAGLDGSKLLSGLAANPSSSQAPIVYLTTQNDGERKARVLERGASDVIAMPVHPAELVARLRLHLRLKRLQDDLRVKNETLGRLSTIDALTGLRTRRYLDDCLSIETLRARRYGNDLTIMLGDLDHFKRVNDEHGHLAGDAVLRGVASILLKDLRGADIAGRYGGEEIMVVLAQSQMSGAEIFGERWRQSVAESCIVDPSGKRIAVTISIGISSFTTDMLGPEALIAAADAALYRAKDAGRNQVVLAQPTSETVVDTQT